MIQMICQIVQSVELRLREPSFKTIVQDRCLIRSQTFIPKAWNDVQKDSPNHNAGRAMVIGAEN